MNSFNQTSEPAKEPGRAGGIVRGVGRLLGKVFGFAVILAAGAAGWFGAEQYAFPNLPGALAAPVNETPWPDEFAQQTTTWPSFTLTNVVDGSETHRTSFDATTNRVRLTYLDGSDQPSSVVELAGLRAFERARDSDEWVAVDPANVEIHVTVGVGAIEPVHFSNLLPPAASPFTRVEEVVGGGGERRFEVFVDIAGLRAAEPLVFESFDAATENALDPSTEHRMVADVRDDGYIVRLEGRSASVEIWSDYPPDLVFESPLAELDQAETPAATESATEQAPADSVPPTTIAE